MMEPKNHQNDFTIHEVTLEDIHLGFTEKRLTSRHLVDLYLKQIKSLNPVLRGVLEVNPDAYDEADQADKEREECRPGGRELGRLHGVPVLLKDGIATKDKMNTTAGSCALLGSKVARDATVVERLRQAGAVILGKASMSEWYRFRSFEMPNGWCARGGQGVNPYNKEADPGGSSSGSAISVAANLVAVSLGTDSDRSIICPASCNSVVGFKPTVGLTSRAGCIPVTLRQDSVGPITRTVADAVHVLDVITGFDPRDEATREASKFIPAGGYKQFLNVDGLKGKRLGIVKQPFLDFLSESAVPSFELHLQTLRDRGAVLVDDLEIAEVDIMLNPHHSGEITAMLAEFKLGINDYLKELITSPVRSLADIIAFNKENPDLEKTKEYGQDLMIASEETCGYGEEERKAVAQLQELSRNGFEKLMKGNELDAMVTLGWRASSVLGIGGYPAIIIPAGYDNDGIPFGICFGGLKGSEPKLIEVAFAFEQATKIRRPPPKFV